MSSVDGILNVMNVEGNYVHILVLQLRVVKVTVTCTFIMHSSQYPCRWSRWFDKLEECTVYEMADGVMWNAVRSKSLYKLLATSMFILQLVVATVITCGPRINL